MLVFCHCEIDDTITQNRGVIFLFSLFFSSSCYAEIVCAPGPFSPKEGGDGTESWSSAGEGTVGCHRVRAPWTGWGDW